MSDAIYQCDCCHGSGEILYDLNKRIDCADCTGTGYVTIDKIRTKPKHKTAADYPGPIVGILAAIGTDHEIGMSKTKPFEIGDIFQTLGGTTVECIALSESRGYECARFSDGAWRYNHPYDRGRTTAGEWDNRLNIVPDMEKPDV